MKGTKKAVMSESARKVVGAKYYKAVPSNELGKDKAQCWAFEPRNVVLAQFIAKGWIEPDDLVEDDNEE